MWLFSTGTSDEEECTHPETYVTEDVMVHPNRVYFDEGRPYVHKITSTHEKCTECGHVSHSESVEEKVYFKVDEVEEVHEEEN